MKVEGQATKLRTTPNQAITIIAEHTRMKTRSEATAIHYLPILINQHKPCHECYREVCTLKGDTSEYIVNMN